MANKTIGLVSVTLNAVNPMTKYIHSEHKEIILKNYLDTGLQDLVREEGAVTDKSLFRLLTMLNRAMEDKVDGVLLTCTVFSPYVDRLARLFSFPIVSVDAAMIDKAVSNGGRTAILYTFPATRTTSESLFRESERLRGVHRDLTMVFVEGASEALQRGEESLHNTLIVQQIERLQNDYDQIVLAQVSMANVASIIQDCPIPILTSPSEAVKTILNHINN